MLLCKPKPRKTADIQKPFGFVHVAHITSDMVKLVLANERKYLVQHQRKLGGDGPSFPAIGGRPDIVVCRDFRHISTVTPHMTDPTLRMVQISKRALEPPDFTLRQGNGWEAQSVGFFVNTLDLGSSAEELGLLRVGDEIVAINDFSTAHLTLKEVTFLCTLVAHLVLTVRPAGAPVSFDTYDREAPQWPSPGNRVDVAAVAVAQSVLKANSASSEESLASCGLSGVGVGYPDATATTGSTLPTAGAGGGAGGGDLLEHKPLPVLADLSKPARADLSVSPVIERMYQQKLHEEQSRVFAALHGVGGSSSGGGGGGGKRGMGLLHDLSPQQQQQQQQQQQLAIDEHGDMEKLVSLPPPPAFADAVHAIGATTYHDFETHALRPTTKHSSTSIMNNNTSSANPHLAHNILIPISPALDRRQFTEAPAVQHDATVKPEKLTEKLLLQHQLLLQQQEMHGLSTSQTLAPPTLQQQQQQLQQQQKPQPQAQQVALSPELLFPLPLAAPHGRKGGKQRRVRQADAVGLGAGAGLAMASPLDKPRKRPAANAELSGVLSVHVSCVTDLPAALETEDGATWCEVALDTNTVAVTRSSHDPRWDEAFHVDAYRARTLHITCKASRTGGTGGSGRRKTFTVGSVTLPLSSVALDDRAVKHFKINLATVRPGSPSSPSTAASPSSPTAADSGKPTLKFSLQLRSRSRHPLRRADGVVTCDGQTSFGQTLEAVPTLPSVGTRDIPMVVAACISEIERRGMRDKGLYLRVGPIDSIRELQRSADSLDAPAFLDRLRQSDIHSVTALLKMFFAQLAEPLIRTDVANSLAQALASETDRVKQREIVLSHISFLDAQHCHVTECLLGHLGRVLAQQGVNELDPALLAEVFAHLLLAPAARESSWGPEVEQAFAKDWVGQVRLCKLLLLRFPSPRVQISRAPMAGHGDSADC